MGNFTVKPYGEYTYLGTAIEALHDVGYISYDTYRMLRDRNYADHEEVIKNEKNRCN